MIKEINLTPREAAARLRVTHGTLANWRVRGEGPLFIKMGRKVLYPMAQVEAFEVAQLRSNTAQKAA